MAEEVRVFGQVEDEGSVLWWVSLDHGESVAAHWLQRRAFRMEAEDGSLVDVEVPRSIDIEPVTEEKGRWSKFERLPQSAPFRTSGPAPHRKVAFRSAQVSHGDQITVVGRPADSTFEGGGMREAATAVRRVVAERIFHGRDDPRQTDEGVPLPEPKLGYAPILTAAIGLAGFVLAALAATRFEPLSPAVSSGSVFGLTMFGVAYAWAMRGKRLPLFIHRDAKVDTAPLPGGWGFAIVLTFTIFMGAIVLWDFNGTNPDTGGHINNQNPVLIGCAGLLVALLATMWFGMRNTIGLSNLILNAPPHDSPRAGQWGRLVGRVFDPTPVRAAGREAAMAASTELKWRDGSGDHLTSLEVSNEDTFLLCSEQWQTEVQPGDATWATDVRRFPTFRGSGQFRVPVNGRLLTSTELIPQGASMVLVGRPQESRRGAKLSMRSTGPESLVFFATLPETDPIAALKRARRRHLVSLAVVIGCLVSVTTVSLAFRPYLPPSASYIPESD